MELCHALGLGCCSVGLVWSATKTTHLSAFGMLAASVLGQTLLFVQSVLLFPECSLSVFIVVPRFAVRLRGAASAAGMQI
jgi:hypothetical protein